MAKKDKPIKIVNYFVHKRPDGTEQVKTKDDFSPEEYAALGQELCDRFMGALGYTRKAL